MYDRFTDRARKVMLLANEAAGQWKHEYIGTEHILLGLVEEGSGVAGFVLKHLGLDLDAVRREVETVLIEGPDLTRARWLPRKLPQTPSAKRVIEHAMDQARGLGHHYVGTEHMLLGLLRVEDGIAAQVLTSMGVTLASVRAAVLAILNGAARPTQARDEHQAGDATPEAESAPQAPRSVEAPSRVGAEFYRRFTDRARKVMQLTNQEAQRYNHEFIGTEHLLLALIMEGSGVAAEVLRSLELDLGKLRGAVEKWAPGGLDMVTVSKLPQTPRANRVIVRAVAEADALGHEQVDTAHLLLALLREPECLAVQILSRLGHPAEAVRERTLQVLMAATPPRGEPPN